MGFKTRGTIAKISSFFSLLSLFLPSLSLDLPLLPHYSPPIWPLPAKHRYHRPTSTKPSPYRPRSQPEIAPNGAEEPPLLARLLPFLPPHPRARRLPILSSTFASPHQTQNRRWSSCQNSPVRASFLVPDHSDARGPAKWPTSDVELQRTLTSLRHKPLTIDTISESFPLDQKPFLNSSSSLLPWSCNRESSLSTHFLILLLAQCFKSVYL